MLPRSFYIFLLFWNIESIYGGYLITEPPCHSRYIGSCSRAVIYFIFPILNLTFCGGAFEYTVEVVISTVVMNGIGAEISVLIHIPFGIIGFGVKAILDVAGFYNLVSRCYCRT